MLSGNAKKSNVKKHVILPIITKWISILIHNVKKKSSLRSYNTKGKMKLRKQI